MQAYYIIYNITNQRAELVNQAICSAQFDDPAKSVNYSNQLVSLSVSLCSGHLSLV